MSPRSTAAGGAVPAPTAREYLPPMGRTWLLPAYDPLSRLLGAGRLHRRLLDQAALRPGTRVLEIGCGTGNLLLLAQRLTPGVVTTGIDPDRAALARARRKARRRGLDVRLDLGYADALPYPDASVDVVLSSLMLHHLPEAQLGPTFHEVQRVLRPGGRLHLLDVAGAEHGHGPRARRAQRDAHAGSGRGEPDAVPALLRACGFEVAPARSVVTRAGTFVLVAATR